MIQNRVNHDLDKLLKNAVKAYEIWVLENTSKNSCDGNIVDNETQEVKVLDENDLKTC